MNKIMNDIKAIDAKIEVKANEADKIAGDIMSLTESRGTLIDDAICKAKDQIISTKRSAANTVSNLKSDIKELRSM